VLGGVAIAERHSPERSESRRLIQKAERGCRYFISQAVYDAEPTVRLLADYARDCAELGVAPRRIALDFVPVGRPQTMTFMRWLGIAIPEATAAVILGDPAPLSRSIAVCRDILRRILDQPYADSIPLGICVESVSINKEEIGATVELLHTLREVAQERGLPLEG
jgi:5,10-methylenetetrahydrofolate reductase